MEKISRIGVDTSKHVFQLHGVNAAEEPVLRKKLRRKEMPGFFAKLPPTVISIEACGASHHWARLLQSFGHTVKLIAPQLVKPYVKRGKNDAADAEALCEAMSRPTMRFVPVKTAERQAALAQELFAVQAEEYRPLQAQVSDIEAKLIAWHKADEGSRRLAKIPGVGPIGAALLMMKTPAPELFRSGRQFAAWIGLTPKDHSTAGKVRLGVITRAGDAILRSVLVVGATAVIQHTVRCGGRGARWIVDLLKRKPPKLAAVALANKMARIAWKLMVTGQAYNPISAPIVLAGVA